MKRETDRKAEWHICKTVGSINFGKATLTFYIKMLFCGSVVNCLPQNCEHLSWVQQSPYYKQTNKPKNNAYSYSTEEEEFLELLLQIVAQIRNFLIPWETVFWKISGEKLWKIPYINPWQHTYKQVCAHMQCMHRRKCSFWSVVGDFLYTSKEVWNSVYFCLVCTSGCIWILHFQMFSSHM